MSNMTSKNHTISKLVAKTMVRLFLLVLVLAFTPLFMGEETSGSLQNVYLTITNRWALVSPALLLLIFIVLLILALRQKYSKVDINWMLSLNAGLLIIYLLLLYSRVYPYVFG